jgi:hypothetical protein
MPARPGSEPIERDASTPAQRREFLVEVYGPLFGALGRLALPSPIRLSDFVNEREGFLRLTGVEFLQDGDATLPRPATQDTEYLINKTGIELICQPSDAALERRAESEWDYGRSLWQAFGKMAGRSESDLRVVKVPYLVQVHTNRFTVKAHIHLAHGAAPEAVLSNLPNKFVPVTDATARFINQKSGPAVIERRLMLVNRDHILLVTLDDESPQPAAR